MSAIFGIYRFNGSFQQCELARMAQTIASLGPDGSGLWASNHTGLGHHAFHLTNDSIDDTLPHFDEASKLAITVDCRLDNRTELCSRFGLKNEPMISDSSLILRAYQRWGKDCPQYLLGEFAVVIWDEHQQELICFTDHSAQRSIYYYCDAHLFAFSSEINALHALSGIARKPNLERIAVYERLSHSYHCPEITWFQDIFILSGRTLVSIRNGRMKRQVYWHPDYYRRLHFTSENEYVEAFQDLFSTIIQDKLRSHHPVITLHSGGLDSSAVTAMAANILHVENKQLTALSAVLPPTYQGHVVDEQHYIHLLQKPNLNIQPITDLWRGPFDGLDNMHYFMNGPNKSSRYYLYQAFATQASSLGARIILDGCYGEKGPSFHGTGYFAELLLAMKWRTLCNESRLYTNQYHQPWLNFFFREIFIPLLPAALQTKLNLRSDINFLQKSSCIKPDFIRAHTVYQSFQNERLNIQYPNHRRHQYQLIHYLDPNTTHLVQDDSGHPIHFSYPFNDKRMLEFCLAIPGNLKLRHGYKRYAIRSGMRGLMPDELRFRTTKEPFSPDFHDRYNQQLTKAQNFVANVIKTPLIQEIIDINRLTLELNHTMQTNRCSTMRDFMSMHTIPFTIYLMAFLSTFK